METHLKIFVGFMILLAATATISGSNHRHKSRHDTLRTRHRRNGRESRETPAPMIQSFIENQATSAYTLPTYKEFGHEQNLRMTFNQNLHKPNFELCATYSPEIYEGQPEGLKVLKVEAIDKDMPDSGGNVTYSIVSREETSDVFAVDLYSGQVTTKKVFDRDEPSREREVYLTVRATDNGKPQLDAVCTIKVKILDINDNKPMFDKYEYKESIPEDLAERQVVMRISATDIDDGANGTITYRLSPHPEYPTDIQHFDIVPQSGEVMLKTKINTGKRQFWLKAIASDKGTPNSLSSETNLSIIVVEPNKKPPTFYGNFTKIIELAETTVDKNLPILKIGAASNTEDGIVFFELVNGQTQPTNKDAVFTLEPEGNQANQSNLKLDRSLDYESVSEYTLTIRATNKYDLASEISITIRVKDENDEKPYFSEVVSGTVLENEPPGTLVMRVRAIDTDGTYPNNDVKYYLSQEDRENFVIDEVSGDIRTQKSFDREELDTYKITVFARDGAPAVLSKDGKHNERPQVMRIMIADKNDNEPKFVKSLYEAEIAEGSNLASKVIELRATDTDKESSTLKFSIVEGNIGNVFAIDSQSSAGVITINEQLDYEKVRKYDLTVRVSDSLYEAETKVEITVLNINDEAPVFEQMDKNVTIVEESIPQQCIFRLRAYDPDISDRSLPQNISFFVDKKREDSFSVDRDGCVRVIKPLDRDQGTSGHPWVQILVGANDQWGTVGKLTSFVDLTVTLTDINDNAPFLNVSGPVIWPENIQKGMIVQLTADDYDSSINGPPFKFEIDPSAEPVIRSSFVIRGSQLYANKNDFDREERKEYLVPILISDSGTPSKTGTSTLNVIIGDENDNPMKPGESKIFVYNYKEKKPFNIGRIYAEDPDDWDLPDKQFRFEKEQSTHFTIDPELGNIMMSPLIPDGTYRLNFLVTDNRHELTVHAGVNVTVKKITDEAVDNSGSIRFMGLTKEQFIIPDKTGRSKKDKLRTFIAQLFQLPEDNVDIFTVNNSPQTLDKSIVDVRFSAHGSPYYRSEKLEGLIAERKAKLEHELQLNIVMIRIDECISEKLQCGSCTNKLEKYDISYQIYTNTSSFVGVNAFIAPFCVCAHQLVPSTCIPNPCLNGGACHSAPSIKGFKCQCPDGFEGPRCEKTSISFEGEGWAWYKPLSVCEDSLLQLDVATHESNAIILYNGPTYLNALNITDFISIEILDGRPRILMDFGSGVYAVQVESKSPRLNDGRPYQLSVRWNSSEISLQVGECLRREDNCFTKVPLPERSSKFLNVNSPLQLGGLSFDPREIKSKMRWADVPTGQKFYGCISNLTFNGEYYNLGDPSHALGNVTTCDSPITLVQKASLGVTWNFIIILLVCILILLILVITIVFYRRRRSYEEVKGDPHDDVRENIINYSDEGGGEGDQTGYDLSVLMKATSGPYNLPYGDKIPMDDLRQGRVSDNGEGPDIQSFLQGNKNKVDNDPQGLPYDDVRNYAYEGDGNSMGSLSSLASGTDEGDLNFDYLPTFGPRFKKLADMYGGQSSDDESYTGPPEAWC